MTNVEKISEFIDKAGVFYFLTTDGDQPKGRPFGLRLVVDGKLYFGCGTFKNVFKQLTANPRWRSWRCAATNSCATTARPGS